MQRQLPPNRLRELRDKRGLKYKHLAVEFGVDPSTVWRWESGRSPIPDQIKFDLADFYGVTVTDLMGWPEAIAA